VVLGGLLMAMLLNMVVVPALFLRCGAGRRSADSTEGGDPEPPLALESR
jgi:hypothetical protein